MSQSDFEVLQDTPQPMIVVDQAGTLAFASDAASDLLGYSRDELVGMTVESLMPERFRARPSFR